MGTPELPRWAVVAAILLSFPLAAAAAPPKRVVSMNACTDQLVMMLLPRERILSVSYLAVDPRTSAMVEEARSLPLNHGLAEEILPLEPDLVVAGRYSARPAVNILKKLGYEVLDLEPETSLDGFRRNLRAVAEAVGAEDRAEEIIAKFDARLARLTARRPETRLVFADYGANGMTSGAGTLVADIVRQAGMITLGEELGFSGVRRVSLEQLLLSQPDVIDAGDTGPQGSALANQTFRHPALHLVAEQAWPVSIPPNRWVCATPKTLDALEILIEAAEAEAS